jgi:hypothetical protein
MSSSLDAMTLEELRATEVLRYGRYTDQYDHAGKDLVSPDRKTARNWRIVLSWQ